MKKNKLILTALIVCLFVSVALPFVSAQTSDPNFTVTLNTPANNTVVTAYACNFNYTPTILSDAFYAASLYIDGSPVAFNATAISNATQNTINYTFADNGVYLWSVQVWNSTYSIASENFTLIVNAPVATVAPTPTPTLTPATSDTDFMIITIFTTIFSFVFLILGTREGIGRIEDVDFAREIIYYFSSLLCSFLCVGLYLSMSTQFALAFYFIPLLFIILNFVLIIFSSWKAWLHRKEVTPSRNRRYYANEDF